MLHFFSRRVVVLSSLPKGTVHSFHFSSNIRMGGPIQESIEKKLNDKLKPVHIDVLNESYMHSVPKGSETHFKVVVVSDQFKDMKLIERHRQVNSILEEELKGGVHALSIQAKTPEQWEKSGHVIPSSPACLGGMVHEQKMKQKNESKN